MTVLDRFRLDGKVAIVTGASSGLGVAFALGLAEAGADVTICARRVERLREVRGQVEERGSRCLDVQTDVTKVEDCERVVRETLAGFGRVDVLVNNAGLGGSLPATREDPDHFRRIIDVNLLGSYWMAQSSGRVMKAGSAIVNIGSVYGFVSDTMPLAAYSSSKAAIVGLTRDLAAQWTSRKGIRVNALVPGIFETEMTEGWPDSHFAKTLERIPMDRLGDSVELVAALIFLASDASSYVTGTTLVVDGGFLTGAEPS